MRWLRNLFWRQTVDDPVVSEHPLRRFIVPLLSKISGTRTGKTVFLALALINEKGVVISEDPGGFIQSLARRTKKSPEQVFEICVQCAREGVMVGPWRFFIVDEVLMGTRQQRLMASHVIYRSRSQSHMPRPQPGEGKF